MKFDVYYPIMTKGGQMRPGVMPVSYEWNNIVSLMTNKEYIDKIEAFRNGDKEKKSELPAICFMGKCTGNRCAANMEPTQIVMLDVDHIEDAFNTAKSMVDDFFANVPEEISSKLLLVAVTPSGKGLRILARPQYDIENADNLKSQMDFWAERLNVNSYGKYDEACHDYSRLSFFFDPREIVFESIALGQADNVFDTILKSKVGAVDSKPSLTFETSNVSNSEGNECKGGVDNFTDEEKEQYESVEYRGTPIRVIVDKYIEVNGQPSSGEIHNYYNEMVKYFRCITDNNKRLLLYLLPRFGHSAEECSSQINSICRVNTLSQLPKNFYFFLKDHGFYKAREGASKEGKLKEYMMSEAESDASNPPFLPPVFRQLVGIAPKDFIDATINALLPLIGTLTSYAQAKYPYDNRLHTTSFFSIVYAPPGTGKGFVERYMDLLFEELRIRDFVQTERENIYLRIISKKGDNEKAPDMPHTSLRMIPPKNSEAEFLQKQRDNHGYHMFTYAAEMDSWAKGVKAAGGNKDDMIRIAWDNGEYGQQFKSANTFKGTVNLYWNVLITGTLQQVENYFKNVENGLVTRCGFTSIENQEFALPAKWRELTKKQISEVRAFAKWCDEQTYEQPCTILPEEIAGISDEDFDKEVDWRFKFREKQTLDCSWIMPVIDKFHKEQIAQAALDIDRARDVFRRRVGVRGFRLALMCMCLYKKPRQKDLENCKKFIDWWMHRDLESMLKLWGAKYNEQAEVAPKLIQRTVFDELNSTFSRSDVYIVCTKQGIKTPVRRIVFDWKKLGYIEQIDKDTFKKKKKQ